MVKFAAPESVNSSAIGIEVKKFLEFLVSSVDFKANGAVDCLRALRNSKFPKKYSTIITNAVSYMLVLLNCILVHDIYYIGKCERDGRNARPKIDSNMQFVYRFKYLAIPSRHILLLSVLVCYMFLFVVCGAISQQLYNFSWC